MESRAKKTALGLCHYVAKFQSLMYHKDRHCFLTVHGRESNTLVPEENGPVGERESDLLVNEKSLL